MNKVLIICGPTASGKSAFALKLAANRKATIINADSMQLYKDIQIISATPSTEDKSIIPHELYGILNASDYCSVADYVKIASSKIQEVISRGSLPIIVGGTGMYINSLMFGFSPIPNIDADLRLTAREKLLSEGNQSFYTKLTQLDPLVAGRLNPGDSQRILRAYEVMIQSGKSIFEFHAVPPILPLPDYEFKVVMLNPKRSVLYKSCNDRFHQLLAKGAMLEVKALIDQNLPRNLQLFKALGVSELIAYIEGKVTLEEAILLAQTKTRQYAKRQVTWFTHQVKDKIIIDLDAEEQFQEFIALL